MYNLHHCVTTYLLCVYMRAYLSTIYSARVYQLMFAARSPLEASSDPIFAQLHDLLRGHHCNHEGDLL